MASLNVAAAIQGAFCVQSWLVQSQESRVWRSGNIAGVDLSQFAVEWPWRYNKHLPLRISAPHAGRPSVQKHPF